jgi:putative nucleotidyltransferase with HDIG domain
MAQSTLVRASNHLVPVAVEALRHASQIDFDLYVQQSKDDAPWLYRSRDVPIESADLQNLLERGIKTLYTPAPMADRYRDFLRKRVLADEGLPVVRRFEVLKEAARSGFDQAVQARDLDALSRATNELGREIADLMTRSRVLLLDVMGIMLHDYSMFAHSANVATYSVLLAKGLGVARAADLQAIATGALLHDVGKELMEVSPPAKAGPLGQSEADRMRRHPQEGFQMLCRREDISWGSLMMVYQHHERVDGSGYPVSLMGPETHDWARMCALANELDNRLSKHAARDGAKLGDVLDYLDRQEGRGFDEDMVKCLIKLTRRAG